jgi:hypothetical protein
MQIYTEWKEGIWMGLRKEGGKAFSYKCHSTQQLHKKDVLMHFYVNNLEEGGFLVLGQLTAMLIEYLDRSPPLRCS